MRSVKQEPESFAEFWPHYVGEHRRPLCRAVHYAAGIAALGLFAWGIATWNLVPLLLTPVAGYGPAWLAHVFVERNRPATWKHVWWSIRGEFKMLGLGLTGRMATEVARFYGRSDPDPDTPLLEE